MMKRAGNRAILRWLVIAAMLLTLVTACAALADTGEELLINGDFSELDSDGLPIGWWTDAYFREEGYTLFGSDEDGMDGGSCVSIHNIADNDARFAQTVSVEPESLYLLSGWIRTENVADYGHGANLSVEGVYVFSSELFDTTDGWQYVELYGETGEDQTEVTVFARLGGYSGESSGKAWFDGLSLKQVDSLPNDVVATLWFAIPREEAYDVVLEDDESDGQPFWPWALSICALWLGLAGLVLGTVRREDRLGDDPKSGRGLLACGLILSALTQLVIAWLVDGYQVDVNCFVSWGNTMRTAGAGSFYASAGFCDYPPAYLWVLGLSSWLSNVMQGLFASSPLMLRLTRATVMVKLVPILSNLLMAWLLYRFAKKRGLSGWKSAALAMLIAFHPALILNSAAWCQMDSVLCLLIMLIAMLAMEGQWMWLMPVYVLAVLVKPQALLLGFLGLTAIILALVKDRRLWKKMLYGVLLSAAVAAAVVLPFSLNGQQPGWLLSLYEETLSSYPYATLNTANLSYLFGGNWSPIVDAAPVWVPLCLVALNLWWAWMMWRRRGRAFGWLEVLLSGMFAVAFAVMAALGCTWQVIGYTAMGMVFVWVLPMYVRGGSVEHLPILGGLLFLTLYALSIKMHERYLLPAVILFAMAYAQKRDERLLLILAVTGGTLFVNQAIILDNSLRLGSSMGHLNQDTQWLNLILSALNTAMVPLALWTAQRLVADGAEAFSFGTGSLLPCREGIAEPQPLSYKPDASLHWKKLDWVLMLSVTLVYSVVAMWNLGSTKAPQNPWRSSGPDETVTVDLGEQVDDFRIAYFAQVSYHDFTVAVSSDGEHWTDEYWCEMAQGQCFRWKYVVAFNDYGDGVTYDSRQPIHFSGRYVRVSAEQVGLVLDEMIFRREDGTDIQATVVAHEGGEPDSPLYSDATGLVDEPDTLEGEPGWYNSTYFDEIYHARTAFEHANGTMPYENTHPPLGKVIMSWCVTIFGMTPFGWRFAGALVGILMLPLMYLLGKQLTKKTLPAFTAMTLLAVDCMHLTQTRIATIDSFPVFFILGCFFFMLRFMQRDTVMTPMKQLLPDLALSGFFMGCAVASKWIGVYAGLGLAVLFFWTMARQLNLARKAKAMLAAGGKDQELTIRAEQTRKRCLQVCLWCLIFFVLVPVVIYLLSYVPYFAYTQIDGLGDFVKHVLETQQNMLDYHSTPGLGMDHPFYSPWYEWLTSARPMYYAAAQYMPEGMSLSIFCFGNLAIWLPGLAALAVCLIVWALRHRWRSATIPGTWHVSAGSYGVAEAFILLGFLAQFLPWTLVPRGTYIYHYFASVPFLCLALAWVLHLLTEWQPRIGKLVTIAYLVICLMFFVAFYPYASGLTVPVQWLDWLTNLRWLTLYHAS